RLAPSRLRPPCAASHRNWSDILYDGAAARTAAGGARTTKPEGGTCCGRHPSGGQRPAQEAEQVAVRDRVDRGLVPAAPAQRREQRRVVLRAGEPLERRARLEPGWRQAVGGLGQRRQLARD